MNLVVRHDEPSLFRHVAWRIMMAVEFAFRLDALSFVLNDCQPQGQLPCREAMTSRRIHLPLLRRI